MHVGAGGLDYITVHLPPDRFQRLAELACRAFVFPRGDHHQARLKEWYLSMDEATCSVRLGTRRRPDRRVSDVEFIRRSMRADHADPWPRHCFEIFHGTHPALRVIRRRLLFRA